jgi:hypothetical protein
MPGARTNQLSRAMDGLTIGAVKDLRRRDEEMAADGLQEMEEQFEIAVSGRAEEFVAWQYAVLKFGLVFIDGTGDRDSELVLPHFTYGCKIDTPTPVGLIAAVMEWNTNDRGETVGCKLAIGLLATDRATKFRGSLHATFQGWGQPASTFPDVS